MNIGLILASGKGTRMNSSLPKQFIKINNKPLLIYTLERFERNSDIERIVLVVDKDYFSSVKKMIAEYHITKITDIVFGGITRKESVYNGLCALKKLNVKNNDIILIHDSARALVSDKIITDNINACKEFEAVSTAYKCIDTIIENREEQTYKVLNRDNLYQIQTPQTFKFELIMKAHELNIDKNASDDAQLMNSIGKKVHLVNGSKKNFKITYQEDIELFKAYLKIND